MRKRCWETAKKSVALFDCIWLQTVLGLFDFAAKNLFILLNEFALELKGPAPSVMSTLRVQGTQSCSFEPDGRVGGVGGWLLVTQTSEGPFSAVSSRIFAIESSFWSSFRGLQFLHGFAPLKIPRLQFFQKRCCTNTCIILSKCWSMFLNFTQHQIWTSGEIENDRFFFVDIWMEIGRNCGKSQTFAGSRCTLQTFSEIVKKFVEIFHNQSVENMALRTNERIGGKKGRLTGCLQDGSLSRKCDKRNSPGTVDFPMHPHFPWTTRILEGDRVSASQLIESVIRKYIDKLDHTLVYKVLLGKS